MRLRTRWLAAALVAVAVLGLLMYAAPRRRAAAGGDSPLPWQHARAAAAAHADGSAVAGRAPAARPQDTQAPEPEAPAAKLTLEEIKQHLQRYLVALNAALHALDTAADDKEASDAAAARIMQTFTAVSQKWLVPWDRQYFFRQGPVATRSDDSFFISLASYRALDGTCTETMNSAFANAAQPQRVFIGLVDQRCNQTTCKSGVLANDVVKDLPTDPDCYAEFCSGPHGQYCQSGNVRYLHLHEDLTLGATFARYLASKLWYGETYFLQIDSHTSFAKGWDTSMAADMKRAPSKKPVITNYPPSKHPGWEGTLGYRMCSATFHKNEYDMPRIAPSGSYEKENNGPRYAPFVAAGFFVAPASLIQDAPFDWGIPYIFMGEEIELSIRFFVAGYDIFSPSTNLLAHVYGRRGLPKFWESLVRTFRAGWIHHSLSEIVAKRIKALVRYPGFWPPEASAEAKAASFDFDLYGLAEDRGRTAQQYLDMAGLDPATLSSKRAAWCERGAPPPFYVPGCLATKKGWEACD